MVRLSTYLLAQRTFIDSVRICVRGGRGGNGFPRFGGVGGNGGNVFVEACDKYTLKQLKVAFPHQRFLADAGKDSKRFAILGAPGEDFTIKCPPGVSVVNMNQNFGDLNHIGEKLLLAKGGAGGGPQNGFIGQKGEDYSLTLDLKLLADVGFVGFPNAGKSTLLKAISRAKPKIASYPFTTVEPRVGIIKYPDFRAISAADLPGLIAGAHMNYGMGHKFLKHCVRTKVLLFVIDIDGFRMNPRTPHRTAFETIMFLNRELELYDKDLAYKPAILAINKSDNDENGEKVQELKSQLERCEELLDSLPDEMRPEILVKFDATFSISAKYGKNISDLKNKIRTTIDIYHAKNPKEFPINDESSEEKEMGVISV